MSRVLGSRKERDGRWIGIGVGMGVAWKLWVYYYDEVFYRLFLHLYFLT